MDYKAKHRFADVGARKIRLFADLIRGKNVDEAIQLLRFYPNRGAKLVLAVVQSAHGNATDQESPDPDGLIVSECRVDGAPMFKRIQPRARGTAFQIKRRMSHIIVTLSEPPEEAPEPETTGLVPGSTPGPTTELPPAPAGTSTGPVAETPALAPPAPVAEAPVPVPEAPTTAPPEEHPPAPPAGTPGT
jgi:large subunit ribosomal protein L22